MRVIFIALAFSLALIGQAQQFSLEKSTVVFFSDAPLEDITATNTKSLAALDADKAEVAFEVPIKDFEFAKDLMKQHFNEKYMDTEKYPKSQFSGKLIGFDKAKSGEQNVTAEGKLLIHGVTKSVKIPGTIELTPDKKAIIKTKFKVMVADYKIKIPQIVWQNIAEEVEVTAEFILKQK